jgi:hypothetical protein
VDPHRSSPNVLLHHDGELADVRRLLDELRVDYVEKVGGDDTAVPGGTWDVMIATPRRSLNFRPDAAGSNPTRIAILDGASRTIQSHLRRIRVDLMVRRPVHPAALRLLIVHALYRGPERRRRRRVSVGAEVHFRRGLFRRSATLTDFSVHGCRLLTRHPVERGKRIKINFPPQLTGGRGFSVGGTVLRSTPSPSDSSGQVVLAIRFKEASDALTRRLYAVLEAHAVGPAMLEASRTGIGGESSRPDPTKHPAAPPTRSTGLADRAPQPAPPSEVDASDVSDRRTTSRYPYAKRVVALGEQATRVLLGRDISTGGMRVGTSSALQVGDKLRIALHAGLRAEPLVVEATVHRDDGERGLILRFGEMDSETSESLTRMVVELPVLDGRSVDENDTGSGLVVSEILDREGC